MTIVRDWLGFDDARKVDTERMLADQRRRLARIDAGLPVKSRRVQVFPHPNRRASDRQ